MKIAFRLLIIIILLLGARVAGAANFINGMSVHSELGQESFIGALFTTNLSNNNKEILFSQEEKQLQVRVLAPRLSARRFKRMWIEGLAINASTSELEAQSQNMANFSNMLKVGLRRGDIFAVQRSDSSVRVIINGSTLGVIDDVTFFDLLLRTWIGPVPLSSTFRDQLLVAGDIPEELQARFNAIRPSENRIQAIAAALAQSGTEDDTVPAASSAPTDESIAPKIVVAPTIAPPKLVGGAIEAPQLPRSTPIEAAPIVENTTKTDKAISSPDIAGGEVTESTELDTNTELATSQAAGSIAKSPPAIAQSGEAADPTSELAMADENALNPEEDTIFEEDDEVFTAESLLAQQLYIAKLKKWTYKELVYPQRSLDKDEQGVVRLNVKIDREGKLVQIDVVEDPGYSRLTKAATKAVSRSSPYPEMPEIMKGEDFDFSLPIVFKIVD